MNINKCDLCPRKCDVNRKRDEVGFCGAGNEIKIAWYGKHFGEEPPISGSPAGGGSGTIFFCSCNLKCVFCQNWQISQDNRKFEGCKGFEGKDVIQIILNLQEQGCQNINLVTPTPWAFWLKEILIKAKQKGLKIPVIWNSNGYEDLGVLREFEGLVDTYLPDYKYADEKIAIKYSSAPNYSKIAQKAILEMFRQVGDWGLIVRHLVLPGHLENTKKCLEFIRSISPKIHLSLMTQYNPLFKAKNFPEIDKTITKEEYDEVAKIVEDLEFENGWVQEFDKSVKCFTPDFEKEKPF